MPYIDKFTLCSTPSRSIHRWLAEVGFIVNTDGMSEVKIALPVMPEAGAAELDKLNTVMGRALWKFIWGNFISPEEWWWDNSEIVDECFKYNTTWECIVLKARKPSYWE